MRVQKSLIFIFAVIAIANAVFAQETSPPEIAIAPAVEEPVSEPLPLNGRVIADSPESAPRPASPPRLPSRYRTSAEIAPFGRSRLGATTQPKSPKIVQIFRLKFISAQEAWNLVHNVFRIEAYPDNRTNSLIVNATEEEVKSVAELLKTVDVPQDETSTTPDIQNLVYRVYMFEIPSGDQTQKPFSLILRDEANLSSVELLGSAKDAGIQVSDFLLGEEQHNQERIDVDILIQGHAPSAEIVNEFVSRTSGQLRELKWDDEEAFTGKIAAAQYTRLAPGIQEHIKKFLGDQVRTVGYWFGNSSAPGQIEAPIGPWSLRLRLDVESNRMMQLAVDVEQREERTHFHRRLRHYSTRKILSNTMRVKFGQPIIIGYNRESYGTRKMGAMVIVPEINTFSVTSTTVN